MDRDAIGLENALDQVRRLVGSQFGFYTATNITIMNEIKPTPPALCFNQESNLYYLRNRGSFGGTLDSNTGVLQNREADYWTPIESSIWLYKVRNKTELDQLIVAPPAVAFRADTSRYYYRCSPEGYGGKTGRNQILINNIPQWEITDPEHPYVTGIVYVPGPNTYNTFFTDLKDPVIRAGTSFTIEGIVDPNTQQLITFHIVQILGDMWSYLPEHDSAEMLGHTITTITTPPRTGLIKKPPDPPVTAIMYVLNLTGIVLIGFDFFIAGDSTIYRIKDIDGTKWTLTSSQSQFANGKLITMRVAGQPCMESRDPDIWVLNSHLYESNSLGFI
jgi:hypothetical protein